MMRKRGFRSKFSYCLKQTVPFKKGRVFIPDEVIYDPVLYVDSQEEFPGQWLASSGDRTWKGLEHPHLITDKYVRLRLERNPENPLHFELRWRRRTPLVEQRYWEIRCHIEGRRWTVHVTKCTETRFKKQVWAAWDKKLSTPGLAVDLQSTPVLAAEEVMAWVDDWNPLFRVSVHHADEANLPKVTWIEKLRWTQSATAAWNESDEAIR